MSDIASWTREHRPEVAWVAFALANFAVLFWLIDYQTVPFHFVWVSLTVLYGFRVWDIGPMLLALAFVCVGSIATLGYSAMEGTTSWDELTEVPLMSAMFGAMVWHARRRQVALDESRRAGERERAFIRDASHQLKTPLAIARGLVDLIAAPVSSRDRRLDLADLAGELDRLDRVAEDLLLLEVAEQPGSLVREAVDVEDLVVTLVRRWSHSAERDWRVDVKLDGVLSGDRPRLESALDAVLENAVHATDELDTIAVTASAAGGDALVEVYDSGVGIAPEMLPHVFERFSHTSDRRGRNGTGLGLPIVDAIVRAHGGTATVRSRLGEGTTVSIRLPGLTSLDDHLRGRPRQVIAAQARAR